MISWSEDKVNRIFVFVGIAGILGLAFSCGTSEREGGIFPPVDGLAIRGEAEVFDSDTLFEYINGAAESYLAYGFEELRVQSYDKDGEGGPGGRCVIATGMGSMRWDLLPGEA